MRSVPSACWSKRTSRCSALKHIMQCYTPNPYRYRKHVSVCFRRACSMHMRVHLQRSFTHGPSASVCPCVTSALASNKCNVLLCHGLSKMVDQTLGSDGLAEYVTLVHFSLVMSCGSKSLRVCRCILGAAKQDATTSHTHSALCCLGRTAATGAIVGDERAQHANLPYPRWQALKSLA